MGGRFKLPTCSSAAKFDTEHKHAGVEKSNNFSSLQNYSIVY